MNEPAPAEGQPDTLVGLHAALSEALDVPEDVPGFEKAGPWAQAALAAFIGRTWVHNHELWNQLVEQDEWTVLREFQTIAGFTISVLRALAVNPVLESKDAADDTARLVADGDTLVWRWGPLPAASFDRNFAESVLPREQQSTQVARELTKYMHAVAEWLGGVGGPAFTSEALHQVFIDLGENAEVARSLYDLFHEFMLFGRDLRNVPKDAKPDDVVTIVLPAQEYAVSAWRLAKQLIGRPRTDLVDWAFTIRLRLAWELLALATTLELLLDVDDQLSEFAERRSGDRGFESAEAEIAVTLSRAAALEGLPVRRAVAAEYAAYLYNRLSQREQPESAAHESDGQHAAALLRAAASSATLAASLTRNPRMAKYVGQNLVELAALEPDPGRSLAVRQVAEVAFLDHYLAPHLGSLAAAPVPSDEDHGSDDEFIKLGWDRPIIGFSPAFAYEQIPSYSSQPQYLHETVTPTYQARGTFAVDLHAGAVLAVQHFKDLPGSARERPQQLAVFDPTGPVRYPLLEQHPVAWLLMLSDRLLAEFHAGAHHPGLVHPGRQVTEDAPRPHEDFHQLTQAVTDLLATASPTPATRVRLPILTRTLLALRTANSATNQERTAHSGQMLDGSHWPNLLRPWTLNSGY